MSLSASEPDYAIHTHPLMAGVHVAPYPYAHRYSWSPDDTLAWCLGEPEYLFKTRTAPEDTAALLVEPVLGEGGQVVPPPGFLTALRDVCDRHRILLVLDEVLTGFGRTGRFFALEHSDVRPDVIVMAKAIASGLPLSALATREDLAARWPRRSPTSTFEANPLACAAAVATLEVIRDAGLLENARRRGARLMQALCELQSEHDVIADVRGLGLMVGVECRAVVGLGTAGDIALSLIRRCRDHGLLLRTCGPDERVISWMPPLVVRDVEIDRAVDIFGEALAGLPAGARHRQGVTNDADEWASRAPESQGNRAHRAAEAVLPGPPRSATTPTSCLSPARSSVRPLGPSPSSPRHAGILTPGGGDADATKPLGRSCGPVAIGRGARDGRPVAASRLPIGTRRRRSWSRALGPLRAGPRPPASWPGAQSRRCRGRSPL